MTIERTWPVPPLMRPIIPCTFFGFKDAMQRRISASVYSVKRGVGVGEYVNAELLSFYFLGAMRTNPSNCKGIDFGPTIAACSLFNSLGIRKPMGAVFANAPRQTTRNGNSIHKRPPTKKLAHCNRRCCLGNAGNGQVIETKENAEKPHCLDIPSILDLRVFVNA